MNFPLVYPMGGLLPFLTDHVPQTNFTSFVWSYLIIHFSVCFTLLTSQYSPYTGHIKSSTYCQWKFFSLMLTVSKRKHRERAAGYFPIRKPREERAAAGKKIQTHREKFLHTSFLPRSLGNQISHILLKLLPKKPKEGLKNFSKNQNM